MSISHRVIYVITALLIGYTSIYVFNVIICDILNYNPSLDPVINRMYNDGKINAYIIFGVFVLFSQFFLYKIIKTIKWRIITSILFIISLEEAFFEIAYGLRVLFGPTDIDIRFVLILYHKQTIILLSVSIIIYYFLLRFLGKKSALTEV